MPEKRTTPWKAPPEAQPVVGPTRGAEARAARQTPRGAPSRTAYVRSDGWSGHAQMVFELERLGFAVETPALPRNETSGVPRLPGPTFLYVNTALDDTTMEWINAAPDVVVAIVESEDRYVISALGEAGVHAILDLPLRRAALAQQIEFARARIAYEQRLKSKMALLERTLASRREIEKATQLLAATRDVSIVEAYQILRRTAMTRRKSVAETAEALVAAAEREIAQYAERDELA